MKDVINLCSLSLVIRWSQVRATVIHLFLHCSFDLSKINFLWLARLWTEESMNKSTQSSADSLKKMENLQTAMGGSTTNTVSGVDRRCSQRLMPSYVWSLSENDIFFRHKISAATFALTSLSVILRLTQARCITIGIERQWAFGLKSVPRATTIPQLIMSLLIFLFFEGLPCKSSHKR